MRILGKRKMDKLERGFNFQRFFILVYNIGCPMWDFERFQSYDRLKKNIFLATF